jgi:hypothetical protein
MAEVKPAEFARICGVAPSVISRKIKNGTLIRNAAGFLDTDNPVNSRYASRRRLKSNDKALATVDGESAKKPPPIDFSAVSDLEISEYAGLPQRLLGLTLREGACDQIQGHGRYGSIRQDAQGFERRR